jgi:predicted ferric reductase
MTKKGLFIALYFIFPIILIYVLFRTDPETYSEPALFAGMALGACAYTWFISELIIIARIKLWERYFGQDFLFRFHSLMALLLLFLAFAHKMIEEEAVGETRTGSIGDIALMVFICISIVSVFLMVNTFFSAIPIIFKARRFILSKRIGRYESLVTIHNVVIIGIIIMFFHVMRTSNAHSHLPVKIAYIAYFTAGISFYVYHKIIKRFILARNSYLVKSVMKEPGNMWTLKFAPQKGEVFDFKPGQFAFIRIFGEGVPPYEHPFSISSEPSHRKYLSVTIKELGDYTSVIKNIKEGSTAWIDAPYGRFSYLNYPWERSIMLIVGGVGITPALSMLRYMHAKDPHRHVTLLWGMNNRNEMLHAEEFKKMRTDMKYFNMVPIMFKDEEWEGERGIIDREVLVKILSRHNHDPKYTGFYICGPLPMTRIVIPALKEIGIHRKRIHFEKFSL